MAKLSVQDALTKAARLSKKGKRREAMAIYQTILAAQPDHAVAKRALATLNEIENAVADPPKAVLDEVMALLRAKEFKQSAVRAKTHLKKYPNSPNLWNLRAIACNGMHRADDAVEATSEIVRLTPEAPEAYLNHGNALRKVGRVDEAIASLKKAIALRPAYPFAFNSLGNAYSEQSRVDLALEQFERAVELDPAYAEANYNLGNTLAGINELDRAGAYFRKTIELNPDYGKVYWGMASITKFDLGDPVVARMLELDEKLAEQEELDHRSAVCFALSKVYRDNKDYGRSFAYLKEGNALLGRLVGHDPARDVQMFKDIRRAAPRLKAAQFAPEAGAAGVTPILILGMPRSGTTLTEQVLACHSQVSAAGELSYVHEFGSDLALGKRDPTVSELARFRARYLDALAPYSKGRAYVTDKMPHNFLDIALIRKALPEAIIISLKRDPAAVCWSNFQQYFRNRPLSYSTDLGATVQYFGMFVNLMAFWEAQYPGEYYTLDYDRFVLDQEEETRALLGYCGLPWEEGCLSPHEHKRQVKTASRFQVNKPVYSGSSEAWRRYEPFIEGVFDRFEA